MWRRTYAGEETPIVRLRGGARFARLCLAASLTIYVVEIADWLLTGERMRTRWAWFASVTLLVAALFFCRRSERNSRMRNDEIPRWVGTAALVLITMLAAALRLFDLARVPLDVHGDFTSIGIGARDLLAGNVQALFASGWANLPWPAFGASALSMALFGDNLFGLRMAGVLLGLATVVGTYFLAAELLGRRIAIVAAAVSAIGYVDIHFSRVGGYIDPVPWLVFGFWLLMRGLRRGSLASFGASGLLLGVGFEMYYSGRLAALVLAGVAVYLFFVQRRLLVEQWRGWLLFIVAAIVVSGPLLFYHVQHWDAFIARSREVYAFNAPNLEHLRAKYEATNALGVLGEQLWRSLLTFNYTQDSSTQFGFRHPFFNPLLAPLLLIGAASSLARARELRFAFLATWLVSGVIVGSALTVDAPFWPRLVILLPVVAVLTALGLVSAVETILALLRRPAIRPWPAMLLALGWLVPVAYLNLAWSWRVRERLPRQSR